MFRCSRSPLRAALSFVLGLAFAALPLRAQLDPRLQASKTDFLDLFQQSIVARPKPEVITVFDFSGSMGALMFHPLYVNTDRDDSGSQANMTFVLSGSAGSRVVTATVKGSAVGTLTSTKLIRPNGSVVTEAIAGAVSPTGVLQGDTFGAADVRNWVRAASHVRFTYTGAASAGTNKGPALPVGVVRTVDIPIPWKVTNSASTGNPLSSATILDQEIKNSIIYGSGLQIEYDTCYKISGGQSVFSSSSAGGPSGSYLGTASTQTSTTVGNGGGSGMYKYAYIDWLITGKYLNGTYTGKYVVFDAANASLAGGQGNISWGQGYGAAASGNTLKIPKYNDAGTYVSESDGDASLNIVPAYMRVQAVKRAAIEAWIANQADVLWAFRFLDPSSEGAPNGTTIHNNSATYQNVTAGVPTTTQVGRDSAWALLSNTAAQGKNATNGNSVTGMQRIAALFTGNSTPLTYATANALAQFNDPNNIFSAVETGADVPTQCMNHFLILFTDGVDNNNSGTNNPNGTTPYIKNQGSATAAIDAKGGNTAIIANSSRINRSGVNWNAFTLSGVAAHMSDANLGTVGTNFLAATQPAANTSATPSAFLPFAIKKRGSVDFGTYGHRITTMTMGISLGGYYTDDSATYPISPKRNLFFQAAVGDPTITGDLLNTLHAFDPVADWIPDTVNGGYKRAPGAIYFFDGTNPDLLADDLQKAISLTQAPSNINETSNPNLPFIGAAIGRQVYLGKFQPPKTGGVMWNGDLLMFATKEVNNQTVILDKVGNPATVFDPTTAQWSASAVLTNSAAYPWKNRKLYTRIPGTAAVPENGLSQFTWTGTPYTDPTKGLKNFVGTDPNTHGVALTDAQKIQVIQLVMGGDISGPVDGSGVPTTNRSNIMGDIVNSSPAAVEYNFSQVKSSLSSTLQNAGTRFRLIFTGTNQGWLHAFGEVSKISGDIDPVTNTVYTGPTTGAVEEMWAFLPTDFLSNLDYLKTTTNNHRFMADGAPVIYTLDLPPATGGSGNGVVDNTERAIVLFGLGKGGRSYYALNIQNPLVPTLQWSIVPDESAYFPASRIASGGPALATVKNVLNKMAFSTCIPALGRVQFNGVLRDVVFFGGGYSNTDIEHNFPVWPSPPLAQQTSMGRCLLVVDVYTGEVLQALDLTSVIGGPIAAGVVPFEYFLNSGMAQRAYFQDFKGGLWAWGSKAVSNTGPTDPYQGYRIDSSDILRWTTDGGIGSPAGIRKVAQDGSGSSALYSTLPAPFRIGYFPGQAKVAGTAPPTAVGIATISGDRNNPLDYFYGGSNPAPTNHRLTVVFDRQDSRVWGLDSQSGPDTGILDTNLVDFSGQNSPTAPAITPGNANYYLAPTPNSGAKFGYKILLPAPAGGFIPKGVNTPSVVAGSLFYSAFTPTAADPCTGGDGQTTSFKVCDVINPIVADPRPNVACISGQSAFFAGIASNFAVYGTRGVVQGGSVSIPNPPIGASKTTLSLQTMLGKESERYPKPRVWRTVR